MSLENKKSSISLILSILMLLALLNNSYFFLVVLKLGIGSWLSFNACSMSIIVYLLCYIANRIKRKDFLLALPILPMYY